MIFESVIILIHQPPGMNFNFSIKISGIDAPYSINMLIACFSMSKLGIIIRTIFRYSSWNLEQHINSNNRRKNIMNLS
jgi:hypothetical protein